MPVYQHFYGPRLAEARAEWRKRLNILLDELMDGFTCNTCGQAPTTVEVDAGEQGESQRHWVAFCRCPVPQDARVGAPSTTQAIANWAHAAKLDVSVQADRLLVDPGTRWRYRRATVEEAEAAAQNGGRLTIAGVPVLVLPC